MAAESQREIHEEEKKKAHAALTLGPLATPNAPSMASTS